MKRWIAPLLLATAAVALLAGTVTTATAAPLFFSTPDFVWSHLSGGATPNHIWVTGDYWDQNFTGTGLGTATGLGLDVYIDDNILNSGDQVNLDVLLNGTNVGNFSVASGTTGPVTNTFLFSPVAAIGGQSFEIQMLETNTIAPGHGSISMGLDKRSFAELRGTPATPEPNTLALVGFGALGLAGLGLRRRS